MIHEPAVSVSVVVVNWHAGELLLKCIESVIEALETVGGECIIVDNGSFPGELDSIRSRFPEVVVLSNQQNVGFAKAANQGLWKSRGRFLLFLNPDASLPRAALARLMDYLEANPGVALIGPRVINPDGSIQGSARGFPNLLTAFFGRTNLLTRYFPSNRFSLRNVPVLDTRSDEPQAVDWVSGACMLVRRESMEEMGGFDEGFFLYWEDADLCWRLRNAGWEIVYYPSTLVVHHVGVSSRNAQFRALLAFHRSAYRIYRKHVTCCLWHPLNAVAALGLALRAFGLAIGMGLRTLHKPRIQRI